MAFLLQFLRSQLFVTPALPTTDFTGQTVIVTGANVGLGLEAARHFTRLNAEKVILGVRSLSKGEAAKADIEASTEPRSSSHPSVVEVWQLDLSSYDSVISFAERLNRLPRVDVLVENAGVIPDGFQMAEKDEATITVNVVSTFLLALLAMPKLRKTAEQTGKQSRLSIVSSDVHFFTSFPERKSENIFETLSTKETANIPDRCVLRPSSPPSATSTPN